MTEETLFQEALSRSPAERVAFLEQACAGRPELRAAVEALLAAHERSGHVLDQPPVALGQTVDSEPGPARPLATGEFTPEPDAAPRRPAKTTDYQPQAEPGVVIAGRYTLQEKIGEGGMGEVWVAKQTEPVKRRVALKLIKAGMDTKAVLQRFDAERQALAMMDHPNIARVLDGGMTADRRPYFVMELVNGLPLTRFCDEAKLGIRERLELFAAICQAVQHAHQKGIIHRDLKPSNILVTLIDARPVPKVIDFGVAKAIGGKLLDESLSTQFGAVVGTLEYMSPEQAGYSGIDIDTRADIYSLGVILYELLTGLRPIDAKCLKKAALTEMIRIIQEDEPSKPSTRLSTDESLPSLAALRQTEPKKLMALLRGELDWVVMKCLEKQRERRYETANELARDIQRYLADEVVEARPPSTGYRLKKFVKRNKVQVIAASLVLCALVAGMIGTTLGLLEARKQEALARTAAEQERQAKVREAQRADGEQRAKTEAEAKKAEAERNLAFAKKGNEILGSVFAGLDPHKIAESGRPLQDVLRENLVKAVKELEGSAIGDPLEVAAMQNTLGLSLHGLGEYRLAVEVWEKARDTLKARLGPEHPDTLTTMHDLAMAYRNAGKLDKALPLYEETLAVRKAKLGPEHPHTLITMGNLAIGYEADGKLDKALPLFEETLALTKAKLGPEHSHTLTAMNNLATFYQATGKLDKALPLFEETLALTKAKLGPEHPHTLTSMNNLAIGYRAAGKLDKALPLCEETLALAKAKLGPDHPHTLNTMSNLAMGYRDAGKLDKALLLFEETLALKKAKLGPEHPDTLAGMGNLADGYRDAGKLDKALPLFEETLALMKAKLGPDHADTLRNMNNLAVAYWSLKRLDKSVPLFEELLPPQERKFGRDHPNTLHTVANLGVNYKDAGRLAEAIPLLEEAYRASRKHPTLRVVIPPLLDGYLKAGKTAEAGQLIDEWLAAARQSLPKDSPQLAGQLAQLGLLLLEAKGFAEAEPLLRECLAIREKTQPDAWTTSNTKSLLGGSLLGQKKYTDAEPLLLAGYEGMKQREKTIPEQGKVRIPEAIERLVQLYEATDKKGDAAKWRKELEAAKAVQPNAEAKP